MIDWLASLVWDLIWLVVAVAVLRAVVNWLFPGVVAGLLEKAGGGEKKALPKKRQPKVRIKEEAVFHVSGSGGESRIVVAKDEAEAEKLGKEALKDDDVVVAEVYDRAVRK